uniref:PQ loop repeat protein n=1 Tax=Pithovirus LCPAC302 TaxID=2506593 RepID=A0A481Z7J9_9VIRU|nr:MAG: PQ loop repeat protein [Pithovirus LCPAC302]
MIIVGFSEKLGSNNNKFFGIAARLLGIISAVCSSIVWLPQIVQLIRLQEQGNLSLIMFLLQTPGNAIIILLQILYKQNWTTWISYVILFIEQTIIVIILIVFKCRSIRNIEIRWEDPDAYDEDMYAEEIDLSEDETVPEIV